MKMNRYENMGNFLQFFASVYSQNPNLEIDRDTLYSYLATYGLTEEEIKDREIGDNFQSWIDSFQNDPNLAVFYTERQPGFLQFHNKKSTGDKHVKLYLSYSKDDINHCVNKIFKYIAEQDMPTCSKVSHKLRSDSVVLRMANFNDAAKVINFINGDYELSNYAKETNPFSIKHGAVGIAYDDMLSYNATLSFIMEEYFKSCRSNNMLSYVSVEHFREFASQYFFDNFKDKASIYKFAQKDIVVQNNHRFKSLGHELLNYQQVIELICISLDAKANVNDYNTFYSNVENKEYTDKKVDYYNNVIYGDVKQQTQIDETKLINSYIDLAIDKYGSDRVHLYLEDYVRGNLKAITRNNDLRDLFEKYMTPSKLVSITGNIEDYVNNYIQIKKEKEQAKAVDDYNMFLYASIETYKKYGYKQLYRAVIEGTNGNYNYFTNGNNGYRDYLKHNVSPHAILNYCGTAIQMYNNGETSNDIINEYCSVISGYVMDLSEQQYSTSCSTK